MLHIAIDIAALWNWRELTNEIIERKLFINYKKTD